MCFPLSHYQHLLCPSCCFHDVFSWMLHLTSQPTCLISYLSRASLHISSRFLEAPPIGVYVCWFLLLRKLCYLYMLRAMVVKISKAHFSNSMELNRLLQHWRKNAEGTFLAGNIFSLMASGMIESSDFIKKTTIKYSLHSDVTSL